jgi:NAD(P)-dependent dehydrogenase (short-subunit alcohol dehydrogenase family)
MSKIAVVTGGSSGIGLAIVKDFNKNGIKVVSWDIRPPQEDVPVIECDVTSEEKVQAAFSRTIETFGAPSILVNNCGLQFDVFQELVQSEGKSKNFFSAA